MTGPEQRGRADIEAEIRALESRLNELRGELDALGQAPAPSAEPAGERRLRVMFADDDPDIRALLNAVIGAAGDMELVGSAPDTNEAIDLARRELPDVAVLDLSMPGGGGIAAAVAIARDTPATKIVAFTSLDTLDAQTDVMRAGAVSFLVKGAPPDEILNTIRQSVRW
jgi:DNA-binding NarL/FixJ family response regulator